MRPLLGWGLFLVAVALLAIRVAGTDLAAPFAVAAVAAGWLMVRVSA